MSPDNGSAGARELVEAGARLGAGVRAWLGADVSIGADVEIGEGVIIVADRLRLGDGVRIGAGSDLRSSVLDVGARSELLSEVTVLVADEFVLGSAGRIESSVSLTCRSFRAGRLFYLGHDSSVGYGGTTASTSHVRIGDRVALGPHSILNANLPIYLGDQVGSGCNLSIWTHGFHFGHRLTDGYDATFNGVRIEANVWLGFHVTVLPGVTIGQNTILAAGAVVARDLPADVLAGGVPAKVLRALTAFPVAEDAMWLRLEGILDAWCDELAWKGVASERLGPLEVVAGATRVVGLRAVDGPPSQGSEAELVLLTLDERLELRDAADVVFELRAGGLAGDLSPTAHDLRDHLRRHALPCGDEDTFRSLSSEPFSRLLAPGRP